MFENLSLYSSRLGAFPSTIIGLLELLCGVNFSPWSLSSSSDMPSLSLSLYNQYVIFLTKSLPFFFALNFSVIVLNPLPSSGQPSLLGSGIPLIVFPSKIKPFGSPSISFNISASLSRLVTVAALISLPSIHCWPFDSIRLVSITFWSTSISSSCGFGFSSFSFSSTKFLSDSSPDNWKFTYIVFGVFGFSSLSNVYFTCLFTGNLSPVYS